MIKNNKFYIENLDAICFFGQSETFEDLIKINDSFNIKSLIITSSHQAKLIDKNIKINTFDNINEDCIRLIKQKCDIDNVYPEPSPRHCELIKEWVVIESKKKK